MPLRGAHCDNRSVSGADQAGTGLPARIIPLGPP